MSRKTRIIIIILIILIVIQFIQPPHNNGSAEAATDITHEVQIPDSVMKILKVSCYDCHSNHTVYPWYSKITPVNWWLNSHVNDGKRSLNFTTFTTYTFKKKAHRMNDVAETIEKHEMPLNSYLWIHKDAMLSKQEEKTLIDWGHAA
ncbi:MAG: heme-binding domain-containing protein, partial [Flavisolibacter sp.]